MEAPVDENKYNRTNEQKYTKYRLVVTLYLS